jgi:hypothetical protein
MVTLQAHIYGSYFHLYKGYYWKNNTNPIVWRRMVENSGTWGISITGNAATAT